MTCRKFIYLILISIILLFITVSASAQSGFFIEGGVGSKKVNGNFNYTRVTSGPNISWKNDQYNQSSNQNTSNVKDMFSIFSWDSNRLTSLTGSFGYKFHKKHSVIFKYKFFKTKPGLELYGYDAIALRSLDQKKKQSHLSNSANSVDAFSWYHQKNFSLLTNIYNGKYLFVTFGLEYILINFDVGYSAFVKKYTEFSANTFGLIIGCGLEKNILKKTTMVGSINYSFSKYKGDDLYYNGLDLNIGGIELEYSLRYYLK